MEILILAIVAAVLIIGGLFLLVGPGARKGSTPVVEAPPAPTEAPEAPVVEPQADLTDTDLPPPGDTLTVTPEAPAPVDETPVVVEEVAPAAPELDVPPPSLGRLARLRERLSRSQGALGQGLFSLLSRENLDEDTWEEIEETLLGADLGVSATMEVVESLRTKVRVLGTRTPEGLRELVEGELLQLLGGADRSLATAKHADGRPATVLVVGVNGTGKTTTCGKLARALVGDGHTVLLGAADTFRAAAADQLETWGSRVGASVVRGPEGGDPAAVAFDAVKAGIAAGVDTVLIDTAGRLHTKTGLMDELGKVKRVVEKETTVDEVLLVLDATTGQNGIVQARAFTEVVTVTGVVLTKLDGTAKGGIVVAVQRELGIPVKLIGLGEGPDDLAPFEPTAFVSAVLGDA